ncbi:hypothetical protein H7J50_20030 [Mycobacterium intermedium]|uniref:hypothetical protein n=1 Tax=Mycobacterium intermedium TaxID=28445 RepID=UPI00111BF74C|nr:hypothetical protein [Mycobacterium intermedium]MCV6966079.1 hypothetical protein [Mycobacterium intermedium]
MSRGFGSVQRLVLDALISRQRHDVFDMTTIPAVANTFYDDPHEQANQYERLRSMRLANISNQEIIDHLANPFYFPTARARWRWYTVDLLGLAEPGTGRARRVSLHRAAHTLHRAGRLDVAHGLPYPQPFGVGDGFYNPSKGVDLQELRLVDNRWPEGPEKCLWLRLPPPPPDDVPENDQLFFLNGFAEGPDLFLDFVEAIDRNLAWQSEVGRFLRWLFCGSLGRNEVTSSTRPLPGLG